MQGYQASGNARSALRQSEAIQGTKFEGTRIHDNEQVMIQPRIGPRFDGQGQCLYQQYKITLTNPEEVGRDIINNVINSSTVLNVQTHNNNIGRSYLTPGAPTAKSSAPP